MSGDPVLRALANEAARKRRLPVGTCCSVCGTTSNLVMRPDGTAVCYGHRDGPEMKVESDHVAGVVNDPELTVRVTANAHERVEEIRRVIGKYDWAEADGDPVLAFVHMVAGVLTWGLVVCEWAIEFVQWLRCQLGQDWWRHAPPFPLLP